MIFKVPEASKTLFDIKFPGEKITKNDPLLNSGIQLVIEYFLLWEKIIDRDYYNKHKRDKSNRILVKNTSKLKNKYRVCTIKTPVKNLIVYSSPSSAPGLKDYISEGRIEYTIKNINKAEIDYYDDTLENILENYNIPYKTHIYESSKINNERKTIYNKVVLRAKKAIEKTIRKYNLKPKSIEIEKEKDQIEEFLNENSNNVPLIRYDGYEIVDNPRNDYDLYDEICTYLIDNIDISDIPNAELEDDGDGDGGFILLVLED